MKRVKWVPGWLASKWEWGGEFGDDLLSSEKSKKSLKKVQMASRQ
jgi:hypothetical protein